MAAPHERRRAPRATHPFLVRYHVTIQGGATWRMAPVRDVSSDGARFLGEDSFAVGQRIELRLTLPTRTEPMLIAARVVWARPSKRLLELTEYGVAFESMDLSDRKALEAALQPFLPHEG